LALFVSLTNVVFTGGPLSCATGDCAREITGTKAMTKTKTPRKFFIFRSFAGKRRRQV
jgi:hypothetical protein